MSDPCTIIHGNCLTVLAGMAADSVDCVVTSPPFLWLRDYGLPPTDWPDVTYVPMTGALPITVPATRASLGLEDSPAAYVAHLVAVFRECARVLRPSGSCWIEIGDVWCGGGCGMQGKNGQRAHRRHTQKNLQIALPHKSSCLPVKNLVGAPWRLAFALQADGWFLRQEVIWHKVNAMPESVRDRPTRAHTTIFILSRSQRYWYDRLALMEPASPDTHARYARGRSTDHKYVDGGPGNQTIARSLRHMAGVNAKVRTLGPKMTDADVGNRGGAGTRMGRGSGWRVRQNASYSSTVKDTMSMRNSRSVWPVTTRGYSGRHYATFTPEIPRRCILAGCPPGGVVLDPFGGTGTTGEVALAYGRQAILIEASQEYCRQTDERLEKVQLGLPI